MDHCRIVAYCTNECSFSQPALRAVVSTQSFLPYGPGALPAARGHNISVVTVDPTEQPRTDRVMTIGFVGLPRPFRSQMSEWRIHGVSGEFRRCEQVSHLKVFRSRSLEQIALATK